MRKKDQIGRRGFIKTSLAGAVGAGIFSGFRNQKLSDVPQEKKIAQYRTLGRTGFKVSDISIGAGNLTEPNVLKAALNMGMNYIDTAEHYVNGQSETTIGKVLKKFDRKSLFITTKLNLSFGGSTKQEIKDRFAKCLERLQTDYVDCLMNHMVPTLDDVKHTNFHAAVSELKADGKVRFVGLSNHGRQHRLAGNIKDSMDDVILSAVEDGRYDIALFVYNFLQKEQGEKIIDACKAKNVGVTLMKINPINFYSSVKKYLAEAEKEEKDIPPHVLELTDEYKKWIEQADSFKEKHKLENEEEIQDAAVKFVLSNPDIHSVCLSITNFEDLEKFVRLSGKTLQTSDNSLLNDYKDTFGRLYCRHACGLCESSCPNNIPVNTVMRYNHYFETQRREKHAMTKYANLSKTVSNSCKDCSAPCADNCPYNVPVKNLLMLADFNLRLS